MRIYCATANISIKTFPFSVKYPFICYNSIMIHQNLHWNVLLVDNVTHAWHKRQYATNIKFNIREVIAITEWHRTGCQIIDIQFSELECVGDWKLQQCFYVISVNDAWSGLILQVLFRNLTEVDETYIYHYKNCKHAVTCTTYFEGIPYIFWI